MKKFYHLLMLVLLVLCATTAYAQKYKLSVQATSHPQAGTTYAIVNTGTLTYLSCKYGDDGGLLSTLQDDDVLWTVEATGEQTEAGYDLYYLYSVGQQKYVQEVDFDNNPDCDGYDVFDYIGFNFELGDKSGAAKITIEKGSSGSDVADNEAWRTNGPSSGYVLGRQAVVYTSSGTTWFMKVGAQDNDVAFEPYNDNVGWQFWTVEELNTKEKLEALIDTYSTKDYQAGTEPGYYDATALEEYNASLENALTLTVLDASTDAEYQAALDDLTAKHDALESTFVSITSDYYYIVSGYDDFLRDFGVEKAAYVNASTNTLYYRTLDEDDIDFVFYIEPATEEDGYWVQDYYTGQYVAKGTAWYNSTISVADDKAEEQLLSLYTPGKWFWCNSTYYQTSYSPYATSSPVASDSEGELRSWGQWDDESTVNTHFNLWCLRRVPSDKMTTFAALVEQSELNATAKALAAEANTLYSNLFSYATDYDNPLITRASGGYGITPDDDAQIYYSNPDYVVGTSKCNKYEFLLDGDSSTYMRAKDGSVYILLDEPKQMITFVHSPRAGTENQTASGLRLRPKTVNLYGYNSSGGESDYGDALLSGLDMSVVTPHTVNMGKAVDRIQYEVVNNYDNGTSFDFGEFQVYESVIDETTSQYYTTEGLQTAAEAMLAKATEAQSLADQNATTTDVIAELRAAIEAVEDLYADTLKLSDLVEECTTLATTVTTGESVGQSNDPEASTTLLAAVEVAKPYVSASTSVADLKSAIAALEAAKDAFMATINMMEEGKFYYLTSASDGNWANIPMYTALPTSTLTTATYKIDVDITGEDYTNSADHMYGFVPTGEDTYYIQNLGTGSYLPEYYTDNKGITASWTPAEFIVEFVGTGFTFTSTSAVNTNDCKIGITQSTIGHTASPPNIWNLVETGDAEFVTSSRFAYNSEGVMALPYNLSSTDVNDNFHIYGIKSITQEEDEAGDLVSTIEFYEKDSAAANEAVFYRWGTVGATVDETDNNILISALPTEASSTKEPANGILGNPCSQNYGAGVAYFTGTETKVTTATTTIAYQLGVIDPTYYSGEVEGVETAFTMTLTGLNAIPSTPVVAGDVNGDGEVTAADAVSVYTYVTNGEDSGVTGADVNGDGVVNSADAVTVYNYITQGS